MCCVGGVSVSLSSLQLQTGDSQLLLVALSQSIEGGHSHTVYHLLQQHTVPTHILSLLHIIVHF